MVLTGTFKFTKFQRRILPGLLLGDAHLESQNEGKSYRLKFEQGGQHRDYLFHLYEIFSTWTLSPPRQKANGSWCFSTVSSQSLTFYAKHFYSSKGQRKVPKIIKKLLTPEGLAYWYMDDGSIKSKESKGSFYNTQAYDLKEVQFLCNVLHEKFEVEGKPRLQKKFGKPSYQIYISGHSYEKFSKLILSHLHSSMLDKFPPPRKI